MTNNISEFDRRIQLLQLKISIIAKQCEVHGKLGLTQRRDNFELEKFEELNCAMNECEEMLRIHRDRFDIV